MGAVGHPADRSRSKTAAAISFVMVVTLGTTAASLPPASTPNSSTTPAAAVTTTTRRRLLLRSRPRRRLPLRPRPRRRRLPLRPRPTTTPAAADTDHDEPVRGNDHHDGRAGRHRANRRGGSGRTPCSMTPPSPCTSAACAPAIPPRSGHSPMGRCTPPPQWALLRRQRRVRRAGVPAPSAVPAGRQWDVTQTTPPPGYYLNPELRLRDGRPRQQLPLHVPHGNTERHHDRRRARCRPEHPVPIDQRPDLQRPDGVIAQRPRGWPALRLEHRPRPRPVGLDGSEWQAGNVAECRQRRDHLHHGDPLHGGDLHLRIDPGGERRTDVHHRRRQRTAPSRLHRHAAGPLRRHELGRRRSPRSGAGSTRSSS